MALGFRYVLQMQSADCESRWRLNAQRRLSTSPTPRQDDPQKGDPALAPPGGLPTAEKVYRPGLRLARPLRWNGSMDQHLLRICL